MALFKIFKGKKANLPETRVDGYAYFTTDDGKFYIDHAGQGENLANRTCINPTMIGATEETAGKEGMVPAAGIEDKNKFLKGDGTWSESPQELRNLVDGSATGSIRGINTSEEDSSYTMGKNAFSEGISTKASGNNSHAEGYNTTASGVDSHAEGSSTTASGLCSHAEGDYTTASEWCSHAEGNHTTASGYYSHAQNSNTIANTLSQTALGQYNIADTQGTANTRGKYAIILGNGTSSARSNAATIDWSGNQWLAGKLTLGAVATNTMDAVTLQQLNNAIPAQATVAEITAGAITDARIVSPKVLHDAIAQMIENAGLLKV